ncbi:MAG: biotin transporter BioY [Lachnospiraceae bacterium]|nr:biotin transporter BioY [Lachnospiraceae bacterium]
MNRNKTLDITYVALGAVLITVCSWLSIPMAVPFTMQTFAVFAVCGILGGRRGTIAVLIYILMGFVGIPVFSGFRGGADALLGLTGGYIIGFVFTALIIWGAEKLFGSSLVPTVISMLVGLAACYAAGTFWFIRVYNSRTGEIGVAAVLGMCVIPFIIPDLVKMALAILISRRVRPMVEKI